MRCVVEMYLSLERNSDSPSDCHWFRDGLKVLKTDILLVPILECKPNGACGAYVVLVQHGSW
jgi:hypothetical protein